MQRSKVILRFLLFSITFLLSSSLYGGFFSNPDDSCPGEKVANLSSTNTSYTKNYEVRNSNRSRENDPNDYLKIEIEEDGQVTIRANDTRNKKYHFSVSKVACGDSEIYGRADGKDHEGGALTNIPVSKNDILYIRIDAEGYAKDGTKRETKLKVNWSDPRKECPGLTIEHLNGTNSNATKNYTDLKVRDKDSNYFHFAPTVDGTLSVDITSDNKKYDLIVYDKGSSCPGTVLASVNGDDPQNKSLSYIDVLANQEIVVEIKSRTNSKITYGANFNFKLNVPPVANAGEDQTVTTRDNIDLDGSASSDEDGTIVKYSWSNGVENVTQTIPPQAAGTYTYTLTVTDNKGATHSDSVTITVEEYVNKPPVAYAGEDQAIYEGNSVTLDGSGSRDPDGTTLSYSWDNGSTSAVQTISGLSVGRHTFILTVTDSEGATSTDGVVVLVREALAVDDEVIPTEDASAINPSCGSFEDVLQTRDDPSKIQHYSGASGSIYDNPDCTLNTSDVDFGSWQKLSCEGGKATASGDYGKELTVNYDKSPDVASIEPNPAPNTDSKTLTNSIVLSKTTYNTIEVDNSTNGLTIEFNEKIRAINSLKLTKNNTVIFKGQEPYNLDLGNIGIVNDGSNNSLTTSSVPKNIKINNFKLAGGTQVNFESSQTIKMESMEIGRDGSNIKLKAQYIQINTLNQSNNGNGGSTIEITADYVDIGTLDLDQKATIIVRPYTAGKRVLFKSNKVEASSSSSMILNSGNYYTKEFSIPGSNNIASVRASDNNQLINFFINGDFKPGNNPGINSEGNSGKFGSLPPKNFMFFINGDLETGGGGTTFNATVYVEKSTDFGSPSYLKGALSSGQTIKVGNNSKFYYDQNLEHSGWGECGILQANDDNVSVAINVQQDIAVLQNDAGESLTIISTSSGPQHGTVTINGTNISYNPNADYAGTDRFEYTIQDNGGRTDSATVYILVSAPYIDADAGVDQTIGDEESATLDASKSIGSCSPLRYNWTYNGGYTATGVNPTIDADTLNTGDNTITLTVRCDNLSDTDTVVVNLMETVNNADDMCYEEPSYGGMFCMDMGICKGGMKCKTTYPIKNIGDSNLSNAKVVYDETGLQGSFGDNCGVTPEGTCSQESDINMGPMGFLGKGTVYDITNDIAPESDDTSVWTQPMMEMGCFTGDNISGSYVKDGKKYVGKLKPCEEVTSKKCANPKEFSIVHQENVAGNIKLIGNTNICKPKDNNSNNECVDPGNDQNNGINAIWRKGDTNSDTQSASAAKLDLSSNAKILWAGLYWQGYFKEKDSKKLADAQDVAQYIKLGFTNQKGKQEVSYQSLSADRLNHVYFSSDRWYYQGFKDVTEFVKTNGIGWYWGADVQTKLGKPTGGTLGAWSIAIIYYDEYETMKNLTVFDGYLAMAGNNDVNNAIDYAKKNDCDQDNTGVKKETEMDLQGFKTPMSGKVSSRLIFFGGEGDIGLSGDNLWLKDKIGDYHKITNSTNPTNNIANSSITDYGERRGSDLLYPYHGYNTIGIDIDTFDVSSIIGNSQTQTTTKMDTTGDGYFPGIFGLSTDLYTPDICYDFVTKRNESIIPYSDRTAYEGYAHEDDEISFNIAIWDIKGDINPRYTSIGLNVTQTKGSIKPMIAPDKAYYSLPNSNTLLSTNYADPMSTIHRPVITIGEGRDDNTGGMVKADERYYTKFYYKVDKLDSDKNNSIAGMFSVDVNGTMNYGSGDFWQILGTTRCPQNPVYEPTWYQFNVERVFGDNVPKNATKHYSLPTRVAAKDFNYEIAAYTKDANNQYTVASSADGITVDAELIDIGAFDDNSSVFKCGNADPAIIIMPGKFTYFNDDKSRIAINDEHDLENTYAVRNTTFRMWILVDENGTINTSDEYHSKADNAYFKQVYIDTYENRDKNGLCASACQSPYDYTSTRLPYDNQATGCYACLRDYFAQPYCARDNFAIRPKAIKAKVTDLGIDGNSTTQSITITQNDNENITKLAAEYPYELNLTAIDSNDNPVKGYNTIDDFTEKSEIKTNKPNKKDSTEAFVEFADTNKAGCNDKYDNTIAARFFDGKAVSKFKQDNVGDYNFDMWDSNFTMVDKSYNNPYKTIFEKSCKNSALKQCNDCLIDKDLIDTDADEKLGCILSSDIIDGDESGSYTKIVTQILPYSFSLELNSTVLPNNAHPEWVYMNDLDEDSKMGVAIGGTITARGAAGGKLTNYTASCVEEKNLKLATAYKTTPSTIVDENDAEVKLMRKIADKDAKKADTNITISKSEFKDEDNGSSTVNMIFNLDRNRYTRINVSDVNFTIVNVYGDSKDESNANFVSNHSADGNLTLNEKKRFFYSRVKEMKGTDGQDIFAPDTLAFTSLLVSTYCQDDPSIGLKCKDETQFGGITERITNDSAWFRMSHHSFEDGKVIKLAPSSTVSGLSISLSSNITLDSNGSTSVINISYPVEDRPIRPIIRITPDEWLKYNGDSIKEGINRFQLNFLKTVQEWKGVGNTGNVINTRPNSQKHNRMGW